VRACTAEGKGEVKEGKGGGKEREKGWGTKES